MSPDPLGGDTSNPQSLNRYLYAGDSSAVRTDTSGLCPIDYMIGSEGSIDPLDTVNFNVPITSMRAWAGS